MIEDKIFRILASHEEGMPVTAVASQLLRLHSGPPEVIYEIITKFIEGDERFFVEPGNILTLSPSGRSFKDLLDSTFVVVDLETTGPKTFKDKITEIGAYKVKGGEITGSFVTLVNPGRYIPYNIVRITGITNDMVMDSPAIDEIIPEFLEFLGDGVFVAHNAPFDRRFVNAAMDETGCGKLENRVLCTCKIARKLFPEFKHYDLGYVSRKFDIVNNSRHRAGGDADATAKLLITMLYTLPEINVFSLTDLLNFA